MKLLPFSFVAATLVIALCPSQSSAESLRCNNGLVSVGDDRASAIQKCGEPMAKDSFCKPLEPQTAQTNPDGTTIVAVAPCENVDEWTYNPGSGQLMTTLRFEAGKLTAIKYGDRVK